MVRVEMRHSERIDDAFAQLFDDLVEAADVVEGDGNLGGGDDFRGDGLFVGVQRQLLLFRRPFTVFVALAVAGPLIVVGILLGSAMVREERVQARLDRSLLLLGLLLRSAVGIEVGKDLAREQESKRRLREYVSRRLGMW